MKIASIKAILHTLNHAEVRYMIAGGVAVNIHGYQRLTHDLDLVIRLDKNNILNALGALKELGYRPNIPVTAEEFADSSQRKNWIDSKHMQVLPLTSPQHPETTLDIFVNEPFDFDVEYHKTEPVELDRNLHVKLVSIPTLIDMKREAGRDRDRDDIKHLLLIEEASK